METNTIFINTYFNTLEMIKDVENIFVKLNKFAKSDILLHNLKFNILASNWKKIFDKFLLSLY